MWCVGGDSSHLFLNEAIITYIAKIPQKCMPCTTHLEHVKYAQILILFVVILEMTM